MEASKMAFHRWMAPERYSVPSPMWRHTRRWPSVNEAVGFHQAPNRSAPWSWTSQAPQLWAINVVYKPLGLWCFCDSNPNGPKQVIIIVTEYNVYWVLTTFKILVIPANLDSAQCGPGIVLKLLQMCEVGTRITLFLMGNQRVRTRAWA